MAKGKFEKWLEPENLILAEGWSRDGLSQKQIAHNMGIGLTTLKEWIARFPSIASAIKKGKEVADYEVENALFKSACGYYAEETVVEIDESGKRKVKQTKKFIPGNPAAQIFWLKNRKPDKWKDRKEQAITSVVSEQDIKDVEDFLNGITFDEAETPAEVKGDTV